MAASGSTPKTVAINGNENFLLEASTSSEDLTEPSSEDLASSSSTRKYQSWRIVEIPRLSTTQAVPTSSAQIPQKRGSPCSSRQHSSAVQKIKIDVVSLHDRVHELCLLSESEQMARFKLLWSAAKVTLLRTQLVASCSQHLFNFDLTDLASSSDWLECLKLLFAHRHLPKPCNWNRLDAATAISVDSLDDSDIRPREEHPLEYRILFEGFHFQQFTSTVTCKTDLLFPHLPSIKPPNDLEFQKETLFSFFLVPDSPFNFAHFSRALTTLLNIGLLSQQKMLFPLRGYSFIFSERTHYTSSVSILRFQLVLFFEHLEDFKLCTWLNLTSDEKIPLFSQLSSQLRLLESFNIILPRTLYVLKSSANICYFHPRSWELNKNRFSDVDRAKYFSMLDFQ